MKRTKKRMTFTVQASSGYEIREEQYDGRNYIVVPVVMMVEGVHSGSHGAILHQSAELAKLPETWNGIPVVVYHPKKNGRDVSANSPDVQSVGKVFNTTYGDDSKLRAEAWLDIEKLQEVNMTAYEYIENGDPLQVSVGVYTDEIEEEGEWAGESYQGIATNYRPDHLALLPDMIGACSWNDGCGIRTNSAVKFSPEDLADGKVRKSIQVHMQTKLNAILGASEGSIETNAQSYEEIMKEYRDLVYSMDTPYADNTPGKYHYMSNAYPDSVVYELENKLYQRPVKRVDGKLDWDGEAEEVMAVTKYKKVNSLNLNNNNKGETEMSIKKCCPEKVSALIANANSGMEECDRVWLEDLSVEAFEKIENKALQVNSSGDEKLTKGKIKESIATMSREDLMEVLPKETAEHVSKGVKAYEEGRKAKIDSIIDNTDEGLWTEESLKGLSDDVLDTLSKSVDPSNYVGASSRGSELNTNKKGVAPLIPLS